MRWCARRQRCGGEADEYSPGKTTNGQMLDNVWTRTCLRRLLRMAGGCAALYVIGLTGWFLLAVRKPNIVEGIGALVFVAPGYVGALGAVASLAAATLVAARLGLRRLRRRIS